MHHCVALHISTLCIMFGTTYTLYCELKDIIIRDRRRITCECVLMMFIHVMCKAMRHVKESLPFHITLLPTVLVIETIVSVPMHFQQAVGFGLPFVIKKVFFRYIATVVTSH